MSNVTSATAAEGPFAGVWEQGCVGWSNGASGGGGALESFGSVDSTPNGLNAIANMASVSMTGFFSASPVIIAVGALGATQGSLGVVTVITPGDVTLQLNGADAAHFGYYADNGASGDSTDFATWVFDSTNGVVGDEFVASEITVVETLVNITLTGQAAGNAGTDVLLTWTATNCADTTFEVFELGTTEPLATLPQSSVQGYVVSHLDADTEYTFSVVGDVNGSSNSVTVTTGCANQEIFNCDCAIEPIYQTLAQMRTRIMIRLGYPNQAANPPPGMSMLVDAFLYDAQKLIWKQLSRAGLNVERFFRWVMVPGQRYYGISANADTDCNLKLDPYKITWCGFEDLNRAWYRLTEGVPPEYYTRANINFGWPTHYEIRSCIELFPAPQAPYTLWIKGDFGLAPLVADDDTATIDDQAVFMLALGNAKAHYGQKDASSVLAQADTYIRGLVAGLHGTRRYVPRTKIQNPATPPRFLPLGDAQA